MSRTTVRLRFKSQANKPNNCFVKTIPPPVRLPLQLFFQFSGQADRRLFPIHLHHLRCSILIPLLGLCAPPFQAAFSFNTDLILISFARIVPVLKLQICNNCDMLIMPLG